MSLPSACIYSPAEDNAGKLEVFVREGHVMFGTSDTPEYDCLSRLLLHHDILAGWFRDAVHLPLQPISHEESL